MHRWCCTVLMQANMTDSDGRSLNISLTAYVTAALSKARGVINSVSGYQTSLIWTSLTRKTRNCNLTDGVLTTGILATKSIWTTRNWKTGS